MTASTAKIQACAGVEPRGSSLRLSEILRKNLISYVRPGCGREISVFRSGRIVKDARPESNQLFYPWSRFANN